jgi:hypothetical protein
VLLPCRTRGGGEDEPAVCQTGDIEKPSRAGQGMIARAPIDGSGPSLL